MKDNRKQAASAVLDWIYPPRCLICREILPVGASERFLCMHCQNHMPYLPENGCKKCGRPVAGDRICTKCQEANFAFRYGYAAFPYSVMRLPIRKFKFDGYKEQGVGLAYFMWQYSLTAIPDLERKYDLLLPVPIHKKKRRERGFNQTEELARSFSELTGVKADFLCLVRTRNTMPQNCLSYQERQKNVKGAFDLTNPDAVAGKRILLIDDIFTTGSTVNECARVLLRYGAKAVDFFVLSIVTEDIL